MKGYYKDTMVVARMVDGEGFLVPVADDMKEMHRIYKLNDLGWFIWQYIDRAADLDELSSLISLEFDVERAIARKDAQDFLEDLVRVGAIFSEEEESDGPHD
ncbi:MAG: PqqD family protein [Deltaproteobacteria bacterium]|nr:PqqD family protein [Deltaproteobacteria bacterium]MBW2117686.1 PqqD family protein [Deltaproteobacteria bacterium]MBW2344827.1 PqqD family protein [Deltaproteobacteria bacterium]